MKQSEILMGDEVKAAHPSLRLFTMHPDLGLCETDGEIAPPVRVRDLSVDWLALSFEEQAQRERDMLRGLLRYAAAGQHARYASAEEEAAELTPERADALAQQRPDLLLVERDGRTLVEAGWWWDIWEVGVWFDPWKVAELQGELMRAWWEPAQERRRAAEGRPLPAPRDGGRVSRATRARLHRGWERAGGRVFLAVAIGVVAANLLEETWVNMLAVLVVVLATVFAIGGGLKWWYERS